MALRNYLYAKHIHDTSIDTKINKDSSLMDPHDPHSHSHDPHTVDTHHPHLEHPIIHVKQSRRRIVRIVNKSRKNSATGASTTLKKDKDKVVDVLSGNIESIDLNEKKENCLKDCNTCDCKKDGVGVGGHHGHHDDSESGSSSSSDISINSDKDTPMIEIEVDSRNNNIHNANEIDFTNAL
ncbi:hypothetical protein Cantr_00968 [Candida viswanathii]|uniref:Uncharacterized protein n=1 Tax=Candida viswanathii TaxID=5486 RepID=A0A367YHC2_9ASCO|nr:hypothetical protein Cantr_00968 [Candida viswanathii]